MALGGELTDATYGLLLSLNEKQELLRMIPRFGLLGGIHGHLLKHVEFEVPLKHSREVLLNIPIRGWAAGDINLGVGSKWMVIYAVESLLSLGGIVSA